MFQSFEIAYTKSLPCNEKVRYCFMRVFTIVALYGRLTTPLAYERST